VLVRAEKGPGPGSLRDVVERNTIALLSNHGRAPLDPPSPGWLCNSSDRPRVRSSGLWNQQHIKETHDPVFLNAFEKLIDDRGYVVLHRANCKSISNATHAPDAFTGRSYRKICGVDETELKLAAQSEGRRDGTFSKRCALCRP
jgi:hypothetical protein